MGQPNQRVSALADLENVKIEVVDEDDPEKVGMSVEDAYRHLAGMPGEPVVEPEE